MGRGTFVRDDIGIFRTLPSTVLSGPDVGISPDAVNVKLTWTFVEHL